MAGCQRGGGVKVNKIDPCAIKSSLTQKTGDQTFELRRHLFLSFFGESKEALFIGGQVTAYENKHCIILVQSSISSRLKAI